LFLFTNEIIQKFWWRWNETILRIKPEIRRRRLKSEQ